MVFSHILQSMQYVQRKITFRLYPSPAETALLEHTLGLHCRVYNTLEEAHEQRYTEGAPRLTFNAMCRTLTEWRAAVPALSAVNAQSLQVTAKRLSRAFDAFFRRLAAGETPGYPRFKSYRRYPGWGYKTYGDGWKLKGAYDARGFRYRRLALTGIGDLTIRGQGRFAGTPKTCEILHKAGKWYASVTFDVAPHQLQRPQGREAAAFDWGLTTLLSIAKADGTLQEIDNPRWLKRRIEAIKTLQRAISAEESRLRTIHGLAAEQRLPYDKQSSRLRAHYAQLRALHGKVARQRKDFYHKLTTWLVETFQFLGTEALAVKNMVKRPKAKRDADTGEHLPNGASAKAGLNRSILDAAPSMLLTMLTYKAEEAACEYREAPTKQVKPTQRCHQCGALVPKTLADREHRCTCGCVCGRDANAAKTVLRWLLEGDFWAASPQGATPGTGEAAGGFRLRKPETPPIADALAAV